MVDGVTRMPRTRLAAGVMLGMLVGAIVSDARTRLPELAPGVHGELFLPPGGIEPRASLILLHGIEGPRPVYAREGRKLAADGYAVLVLDYYAEAAGSVWTGTQRAQRWAACQAALERAVNFVRSRPGLPAGRIGLIGFSQGAAVALATAPRLSDVSAVVDFFGPSPERWYVARFMGGGDEVPPMMWAQMPPVLILHGSRDPVVPVSHARQIEAALREHGREVELHIYPREMHGLHDPENGLSHSTVTADDAHRRMREFLALRFPTAG